METQRENPTSDPDAWASITYNELLSEHRKDETEKVRFRLVEFLINGNSEAKSDLEFRFLGINNL
jgi:hypothetical protein